MINRRHVSLCGEDQYGESWVSTTIAEIDLEAKEAMTISWRPYKLRGEPNSDHALREALSILSRAYDLDGVTVEAISLEEADAWLGAQAVKPSLSDDDKVRNEQNRRKQTWTGLRFQAEENRLGILRGCGTWCVTTTVGPRCGLASSLSMNALDLRCAILASCGHHRFHGFFCCLIFLWSFMPRLHEFMAHASQLAGSPSFGTRNS